MKLVDSLLRAARASKAHRISSQGMQRNGRGPAGHGRFDVENLEPRLIADMSLAPSYGSIAINYWLAQSAADYQLFRGNAQGEWTFAADLGASPNGSYADPSALVAGSAYRYGIFDDQGNALDAATLVTASQLSASVTAAGVVLIWDNNDPSLQFSVQRNYAPYGQLPETVDFGNQGNSSSFSDTPIRSDGLYSYHVTEVGSGVASNAVTILTAPAAPTIAASVNPSNPRQIDVSICGGGGDDDGQFSSGDRINLYAGLSADFAMDAGTLVAGNVQAPSGSPAGFSLTQVAPNTAYYFKAATTNLAGIPSLVTTASVQTPVVAPVVTASGVAAAPHVSLTRAWASFTTSDAQSQCTDYAASVSWGDGSSASSVGADPGLAIVANGSGFAVTGAHTYQQAGSYTATFSVTHTSSGLTGTADAGVNVASPDLSSQSLGVAPGENGTINHFHLGSSDPNDQTIHFSPVSSSETLSLSSDGALDVLPSAATGDQIVYRLQCDLDTGVTLEGNLSSAGVGFMEPTANSTASAIAGITTAGAAGSLFAVDVSTNDLAIDNPGTLIDTAQIHGSLAVASDGSYTYTPDVAYSGPAWFTYQVRKTGTVTADQTGLSLYITQHFDVSAA